MAVLPSILRFLVITLQPFLVPFCAVIAWVFLILLGWSIVAVVRSGVSQTREMHRIPCANCSFFTKDYVLKCTVHPSDALSEAAINCPDYEPVTTLYHVGTKTY